MTFELTNKIRTTKYLAALGALLLNAVYTPLALFSDALVDKLAPLVAIIGFALLIIGAKKLSHALPAAVIYFLLYAMTASHLMGSVFILTFVAASLMANELIFSGKSVWRAVIIFALVPVSAVLAYLLARNVVATAIVALPYLVGALLWLGVRFKKNRKSVILLLTVALTSAAILGVAVYALVSGKGALGLRDAYISARDSFIDYVCSYSVDIGGEIVYLFEDISLARQLLVSMSNALPSAAIIAIIILSYFIYNYQASMLEKFGGYEYITEDIMEIKISAAAAAVYLIAFVLSITTDSHGEAPFGSVVCQNIYAILTPALAYAGVQSIRRFLQKKRIRVGFLLILPLALLAMTGYIFMILALVGIICIFADSARAWAEKKD